MHNMDGKKHKEKNLERNYTRMLRAVLKKFRKQHPTKQQLYGHLPPITQTIQVSQTRDIWHYWRSKNRLISNIFWWNSYTWTCQCWLTNNYLYQLCAGKKTSQEQWMIGMDSERKSENSMVLVWLHDDDDDDER